MKIYLIQGFFFQNYQWLSLGMGVEGTTVFVKEGLCHFMFAGIIYSDKTEVLGALAGQMNDQFGHSVLSQVMILPHKVTFVKKYVDRNYEIKYTFRQQDSLWVGSYSGERAGEGGAKCVITEVTENLFKPPERS